MSDQKQTLISETKEKMFFVYVDWTTEDIPRPYYVGYGQRIRIINKHRNKHHTSIRQKFGFKREIVLVINNELLAKLIEISLIAELKTYIGVDGYSFGCNYTFGGDGSSGHRQPPCSPEHRQIMSEVNSHPKSDETKRLMSIAAKKRASDPEWIEKMRIVALQRWQNPEHRSKRIGMKYNRKVKNK